MAMTAQEMISFFHDQAQGAKQGLDAAIGSSNYYLAAVNVGEEFKCCVMKGLIGWRTGLASPALPLKEALQRISHALVLIKRLSTTDCTKDVPVEKASIVSFLVDEKSATFGTTELSSDRLLDAVLGKGLRGNWDESRWREGLEQLRKTKGAALAVETYSTYDRLLHGEEADRGRLVDVAIGLFEKRGKDSFYRGGDQTEGGGPDNATTVDYRLAAVMKKIGYAGDNIHHWRWS